MLIALWIINGLAALAFLGAGLMKAIRPKAALAANGMAWTDDFSAGAIKTIGAVEALGALGLVLPLALNLAPLLTPLASTGLAIIMIGAIIVHARRKESAIPAVVLTLVSVVSAVLGYLVVLG